MAASEVVSRRSGAVKGVVAGVFGVGRDGQHKPDYQPGVELRGKYTFIAEGARGSLAKQIQAKFGLCEGKEPQKFGIGLKEIWQVPDDGVPPGPRAAHRRLAAGRATPAAAASCTTSATATWRIGFVVHLNYKNPWLSPFDEFQRLKHHPAIRRHLEGGKRIAYGARAITEGGYQSVPKLTFPGGALIGCAAGFVNLPRIKGSHNAMKTGMLAAEAAFAAHRGQGEGRRRAGRLPGGVRRFVGAEGTLYRPQRQAAGLAVRHLARRGAVAWST